METMNGIQPMYDMSRNNNEFGNNWFWIIVLLLFGNNGWNNRGDCRNIDEQFLTRDVFATNTNVLTSTSQLQQDIAASTFAAKDCCCQTKQEILQNRYENALQTNTLQALLQQGFCDIKTNFNERITALELGLKDDKIAGLRESLFTATQAYNNQQLANSIISNLQPVPKPAYVVNSPYATNYYPNACPCQTM